MRREAYTALGRLEAVIDRINSIAIKDGDDVLLTLTATARDRCKQVRDALDNEQKDRLEEQLNASLELINRSPERLRRQVV